MQGLTDPQIEELELRDEWDKKCVPRGGAVFKKTLLDEETSMLQKKKEAKF